MQWEVKNKIPDGSEQERREAIIKAILKNRGLTTSKLTTGFTNPQNPETLTPENVGIGKTQNKMAIDRVKKAIVNKQRIVVYGDYDADGICATAILWETLHSLGAQVLPFIPHREKHGYGLSIKGIEEILKNPQPSTRNLYPERSRRAQPSLIITVDNGIVAHEAVKFANTRKIDVIVCDHHEKAKKLPEALAIVHTTKLAGAGVAWVFSQEILKRIKPKHSKSRARHSSTPAYRTTLDLAAIGTVADMVPLLNANRSIVKFGLLELRKTERVGLRILFAEAQLNEGEIDTHHINFIIAPRLNAMGRLEHALDALRLICTKKRMRARLLAEEIGTINRRRQKLTEEMLSLAKELSPTDKADKIKEKILIIDHDEFHEGIVGLIAGKLVDEFYRPTIVFARGKKTSKASARSIRGFNIIKAIRKSKNLLIDVGGHPMAAGFTIKTENIEKFKNSMRVFAKKTITNKLLEPKLTIDCEIKLKDVRWELIKGIDQFKPFGIGNSKPKFVIRNCDIHMVKAVGSNHQHLSLMIRKNGKLVKGIAFKFGFLKQLISPGKTVDLACTLDKNVWNGKTELQMTIKDIKIQSS